MGTDGHRGLAPDAHVLLVGTGLTAVDVAISLDQSGFRGSITALSRRGLIPHACCGRAACQACLAAGGAGSFNRPTVKACVLGSVSFAGYMVVYAVDTMWSPQDRNSWLRTSYVRDAICRQGHCFPLPGMISSASRQGRPKHPMGASL
jgi:hypothetical protein